jgi:hypothetical protein
MRYEPLTAVLKNPVFWDTMPPVLLLIHHKGTWYQSAPCHIPEDRNTYVIVTSLACVIGPTINDHIIYAVDTTYLNNLTDSDYRF